MLVHGHERQSACTFYRAAQLVWIAVIGVDPALKWISNKTHVLILSLVRMRDLVPVDSSHCQICHRHIGGREEKIGMSY